MRHGAMLLCSALNLIFEHGRISGSGKVNGAEAKWTWPSFFRSKGANSPEPDTNFARVAHVNCKLVGFTNSFYRGTKNHEAVTALGVAGALSLAGGASVSSDLLP